MNTHRQAKKNLVAMHIESLPPELLELIASHVSSFGDLKNLRLTSRSFDWPSAKALFRCLCLKSSPESIRRYQEVSHNFPLACLAHELELRTFINIDWVWHLWSDRELEFWEPPPGLHATMALSGMTFPNASAINFAFSAGVRNQGGYQFQRNNEPGGRAASLNRLFRCLDLRSQNEHLATVRRLTLTQISNFPHDARVHGTPSFKAGIAGITSLHMFIRGEKGVDPQKLELEDPCLMHWPNSLASRWIKPIAANLTSLSLYHDYYWGVIPHHDVRKLKLPQLRSLALGNFTIAYRRQLDWILSLTSLESLILDDSPIIVFLSAMPSQIALADIKSDEKWLVQPTPSMRLNGCFLGVVRWSEIFKKIRRHMNKLTRFSYGHGRKWRIKGDRYAFEDRYNLENRLCETRYVAFNGRSPFCWKTTCSDHHPVGVLNMPCVDEFAFLGRREFTGMVDDRDLPVLDENVLMADAASLGDLLREVGTRSASAQRFKLPAWFREEWVVADE